MNGDLGYLTVSYVDFQAVSFVFSSVLTQCLYSTSFQNFSTVVSSAFLCILGSLCLKKESLQCHSSGDFGENSVFSPISSALSLPVSDQFHRLSILHSQIICSLYWHQRRKGIMQIIQNSLFTLYLRVDGGEGQFIQSRKLKLVFNIVGTAIPKIQLDRTWKNVQLLPPDNPITEHSLA